MNPARSFFDGAVSHLHGGLLLCGLFVWNREAASAEKFPRTGVTFHTADAGLQQLFDAAEAKTAANVVQFTPSMKVLVEGGGYRNAWIETQPLGGEMYAKRDVETALNNQLVFMLGQRADGRLPGMVINSTDGLKRSQAGTLPEGMIWMPDGKVLADFAMFQGYCFPDPAWRMYFWIGRDKEYLRKLYAALEAHDDYLWRTRDSNADGLLETWCVWDTGEDNSTRLVTRNAPTRWPFEFPPGNERAPDPQGPTAFKDYWRDHFNAGLPPPRRDEVRVPFASMDVMAYSYDGRAALAKIARELGNRREAHWLQRADTVKEKLRGALWSPARHACFDNDSSGRRLEELVHNNLRVMYHGAFSQSMADEFIRHHLLNPDEFWTPIPLPSIAVNEPLYRNTDGNSWSGQPQGLTYQRAVRALENYGHYAEVTLLGQKLLPVLIRNGCKFAQQLDAQTGKPSGPKDDGYGPMMLAAMEYISRMHGVYLDVASDRVCWSAVDKTEFTYVQRRGDKEWALISREGQFTARVNGRKLFSSTAGVRVATDSEGVIREIVGIAPTRQSTVLREGNARHVLSVDPNQVHMPVNGNFILSRAAPFDFPQLSDSDRANGETQRLR